MADFQKCGGARLIRTPRGRAMVSVLSGCPYSLLKQTKRKKGKNNDSSCCVLGPRLPLGRALERLTIGLGTRSRVGEIKPSSKVESVVIFHYLPTRSVTTLAKTQGSETCVVGGSKLSELY